MKRSRLAPGPWRRSRPRDARPGVSHPAGAGWPVLCRAIRRRDKATCRYCGHGPLEGKAGAVDHLLPRRLFRRGQGDFPENLALLCAESCHAVKTQVIEPALYRADYLTFRRWLDVLRQSGPAPRADQLGAALFRLRQMQKGSAA